MVWSYLPEAAGTGGDFFWEKLHQKKEHIGAYWGKHHPKMEKLIIVDIWLVVWNMAFIFPFSWECHHPI